VYSARDVKLRLRPKKQLLSLFFNKDKDPPLLVSTDLGLYLFLSSKPKRKTARHRRSLFLIASFSLEKGKKTLGFFTFLLFI